MGPLGWRADSFLGEGRSEGCWGQGVGAEAERDELANEVIRAGMGEMMNLIVGGWG